MSAVFQAGEGYGCYLDDRAGIVTDEKGCDGGGVERRGSRQWIAFTPQGVVMESMPAGYKPLSSEPDGEAVFPARRSAAVWLATNVLHAGRVR